MKQWANFLLAALTGLLLAIAFPPSRFPLIAFIGFVPLLFVFEQPAAPRNRFLLLYTAFFIYHGITAWWIGSFQPNSDIYLIIAGIGFSIIHPFFFMVPFAVYLYVKRKIKSANVIWLFPALWVAFEWLHGLSDLSFPWLTIGYSQMSNLYWVQFIDITGIFGASLLICIVNVAFLKIIQYFRENTQSLKFSAFFSSRALGKSILIILLSIIIPYIYGIIKMPEYSYSKLMLTHKSLKIGIIQPNVNPWRKWDESVIGQIKLHEALSDSLSAACGKPDLFIWSETAVPYLSMEFNSNNKFSFLQSWIDISRTPLLTGFCYIRIVPKGTKPSATAKPLPYDSTTYYEAFNSALALHPAFAVSQPQIYRKMKLTPFSERFPFVEYLSFAKSWFEWGVGISSWTLGDKQFPLEIKREGGNVKIGSIICIESIYPCFCRLFAKNGAEILTVITNDGWYDNTPGPAQHYAIAAARAIESRRCVARCANTGISGFILPSGDSYQIAPTQTRLGISAYMPLSSELTFYAKIGDWLPYLCLILSLWYLGKSIIKRRKA